MSVSHEVVVRGWIELVDELYRGSWDSRIGRFRSSFVYRGMGDAGCGLNTKLVRVAAGFSQIAKLEAHILRNFRKYAHSSAAAGNSVWHWLALAQHHGLQHDCWTGHTRRLSPRISRRSAWKCMIVTA